MSRRQFLVSSAALGVAFPVVARLRREDPIQFGLIADAQYADQDPKGTRFYRNSLAKLQEAVSRFDASPLQFCINLGDLIDRDWHNYEPALAIMRKSRHRFYHVTGNHDFEVADELKRRVPKRIGLKRAYYSFNRGAFCFVFLNTNELSTYAHPAGSPEHAEALETLSRLGVGKAMNAKTWNGQPNAVQMMWFDKTCQKAAEAGRKVLVFAHHPVFPRNEHNAWNDAEVLAVIEKNHNVAAWINGHNHAGLYGECQGVPFLTLRGMVETARENSFAVCRLYADRLVVTGSGREPSRELSFPA